MRVVLDANVFVSSLIEPRGPSAEIFKFFLANPPAFELSLSPAILKETRRVLDYPRIRRRLKSGKQEIEEYLLSLQVLSIVVEPQTEVDIIIEDPADNEYLACAQEAEADYIVTGDSHLLNLRMFGNVQIVTPRQFVSVLHGQNLT